MYILDTVLIIIFLILFPFLLKSFIVVCSHEVVIVERFGHYHRTIEAGTHIILPFIEKRKK